MPSLKHNTPISLEVSSDTAILAESGVRAIPPEAREALKAIAAARTNGRANSEKSDETYQAPVGPSTQDVCPKMLEAHVALVHQVVAPIARRVPANVQRDDLLAAGFFGLVDSLRKNGGDNGITFEWYARMRIRGAVLDELRAQDWLSRRARDAVNALADRENAECESVLWVGFDELSDAEEAEFLSSYHLDPEAVYEAKETMLQLAAALDKLSERERVVVNMHYAKQETFKAIAFKLGVSETRAFQIHARALDRLKNMLSGKRSSRPSMREVCLDHLASDGARDDWNDESLELEHTAESA
jgi:RNA polymerase sigma factor FliA